MFRQVEMNARFAKSIKITILLIAGANHDFISQIEQTFDLNAL